MTAEKPVTHKKERTKKPSPENQQKRKINDETDSPKSKAVGGHKKLKQAATDKKLLDYYWALASDDPKERLEAAIGLLKGLNESDSEADWKYAFDRLLKGLSSSRGSARLGFSMALSEVLNCRQDFIDVWLYLDSVAEYFNIPSNANGHEERGLNFGTLFALRTLAQSPLLFKSSTTIREFERFIDLSLELAQRKIWLRESVFFALCDLIKKLTHDKFENLGYSIKNAIELTLKKVQDAGVTLTSEGVALYLSLDEGQRNEFSITGGWKNNDPLLTSNLVSLAKALKEVPVNNEQNEDASDRAKLKGNWKPTLHFVWELLIQELNGIKKNNEATKSKDKKSNKIKKDNVIPQRVGIDEFWKVVVDESLFANSASSERKYWGFEVFILFLQLAAPQNVKDLFSPNFVRCLTNQLSQQDRLLNKEAKKVVSSLQDAVAKRPEITIDIVECLLEKIPNFDVITKTKTLSNLILAVPSDQISRLVDVFVSIFEDPKKSEEKATELRRQWALDNLLSLVKTRRSEPGSSVWIEQIINVLVKFGFFKGLGPAVSPTTVENCHTRLNSVLSLTVGSNRDDNRSWAFYVLNSILSLEEAKNELVHDFEGDLLKAKNKSIKTLEKIRKKRSSSTHADTSQLEAFELLFSLVLIQVYSTDSEAATVLDELQMCYNNIIGKSCHQEDDGEEVDATQVLSEILLSFLSRRSALLRRLSETVWSTFTSQITKESLQLLYDVLESSESAQGQGELFDEDDDNMEIDEEDEDDEENEADDEEDDENDDDDDDEISDEEEEDDDDDAVKEADRQAHEALAKALGINEEGEASQSIDEDDDDDESMDDEQMMALDEQLAGIFRERQKVLNAHKTPTQKKQASLEAKQNMVQFKSRVLDLLEIYIKAQSSSPLLLTTIPSLLTVIRITRDVSLGDKAHQLLKNKLCKVKTLPKLADGDVENALEILSSVHAQARRSTNKAHSLACNQASVFLSKTLLNHDKDLAEKISSVYASSLTDWIKVSHSKISPALFFDFVNYIASTKNNKK
ncbi:Pol5p [Sugiyamaella lignohabitans]|uniref:Pol5p n=1 Tax=Sugiyamaella lignohabitans TaxID=796027 RepID=A0A161HH18_9ASCO|nr:Pol5p [Sugiyamaella lignohabitans]ANB15170.1 Pol5p [Sugiyamaella lignohabitans]